MGHLRAVCGIIRPAADLRNFIEVTNHYAALVSSVLPLVLKKVKVDPAVVSAPMIATIVDGTGLMINVSRAILYAASGDGFADAAADAARELRDAINRWR